MVRRTSAHRWAAPWILSLGLGTAAGCLACTVPPNPGTSVFALSFARTGGFPVSALLSGRVRVAGAATRRTAGRARTTAVDGGRPRRSAALTGTAGDRSLRLAADLFRTVGSLLPPARASPQVAPATIGIRN